MSHLQNIEGRELPLEFPPGRQEVRPFKVVSPYEPSGDQPQAIQKLAQGIEEGLRYQTLLGVTGSGKTFTMAKTIEYTGNETPVTMYWNVSETLNPGTYSVSVFADGNLIGQRNFTFK